MAESRGAIFHDTTQAIRVISDDRRLTVETTRETWTAPWVVLAAGSWAGRVQLPHVRALAGETDPRSAAGAAFPEPGRLRRVLWGPRCYLVPWPDGQLLVGATVEDVGFAEHPTVAGVQQLLAAVTELLPDAPRAQFDGVRVGLRPATPDELPILGPSTRVPGLVYATGHYRNGVLLAPLTAAAVPPTSSTDASDPVFELTRPRRFGGALHFLAAKRSLRLSATLCSARFTAAPVTPSAQRRPGTGAMRGNASKPQRNSPDIRLERRPDFHRV